LGERVKRKQYKKKIMGRVEFRLGDGVKIGAKFYTTVMKMKKPVGLRLSKNGKKMISSVVRYKCQESGTVLYEN
jgi:hypothetical protein